MTPAFPPTPPRPSPTRTPALLTAVAVAAILYIVFPIFALGLRVPWASLGDVLTAPDTAQLLRLTLSAAVLSTLLTLLLGVPLALWLQSLRRGAQLARLLVLLPLAMPPVVAGLALSAAAGNRGLLAPLLDAAGLTLAFAFPGVVIAHTFVSLPFVIVTVDSALRQIDREVLHSAAGVGMGPRRVLTRITLPTVAPALATGAGLAFARSLGEFGTTITFVGSMPGVTRTMSLAIYLEREVDRDNAYALSAILIILAVVALAMAATPALLRREPAPQARSITAMDAARLRELTRPDAGGETVTVTSHGVEAVFPADQITAVVGPNGSGKSTLMGLIAGRLRGADVRIGDRVVDGRSFLPAHRRGVVLLTQKPGLPRTATVRQALTMVTRDADRSEELLDAAGLAALAEVAVPALSGGQAAQVALVRALAARPRVLLLDEPLAAVDVASGTRWRRLLRATAGDRTTVLVTHDAVDVAGLADRLAVVEKGSVVADGPANEVLEVPPTDFVAELAGLNVLSGLISGKSVDKITVYDAGLTLTGVPPQWISAEDLTVGSPAVVTAPPEATTLRIPGSTPRESASNVWSGTVSAVDAAGMVSVTVTVTLDNGSTIAVPVTRSSALSLGLEAGTRVECVTKALSVTVYPHGS